jgi:hypothetical protein
LFATDEFIDAFSECDFAEHGRPVIRIEAVLATLCPLALLDKPNLEKFVQMIVEGTVIDVDHFFKLLRTHVTAVDEPIEDFVSSPMADGSMHIKVLLKPQDAIFWKKIFWVRAFPIPTDCLSRI